MAPDVEELIQKVNSLTVDKNRLRQKLSQLTSAHQQQQQEQQTQQPSPTSSTSSHSLGINTNINQQLHHQSSSSDKNSTETCEVSPTRAPGYVSKNQPNITSANIIAGVECLSSCEDDLLFMNDLYRKRIEEYNENWALIQSKCSALLSELNALQRHYAILKKEKLEVEANYKSKCDDVDKINCELQTVVLNYETQLSAMSEHLTAITSQVGLDDLG